MRVIIHQPRSELLTFYDSFMTVKKGLKSLSSWKFLFECGDGNRSVVLSSMLTVARNFPIHNDYYFGVLRLKLSVMKFEFEKN